jgi:hypothetical protein
MLSLLAEHPAELLDVVFVEFPVPRRGPLRVHEALTLEKTDFRDGDIGEFLA